MDNLLIKVIEKEFKYFYSFFFMNTIEKFKRVQNQGLELFRKKNEDYGEAYKTFGLIGVLTRLEDKILRCINISQKEIFLVEEETLKDTLLDLHNYTALALMLLEENQK